MNLSRGIKKIILITSSVLVSLILIELGLRLIAPVFIYSPLENQIEDDKLGRVMDPALKDIDENGFRNPDSIEQADIVALGDSHTYGVNVVSEKSWPRQLGDMSDMTVYNLGVGGYGSLQYYYLYDKALKLKPKHIILALYVPNDLDDVCKLIDISDYWHGWAREHGYNDEVCFDSSGSFNGFKEFLSGLNTYWMAATFIKRAYEATDLWDSVVIRDEKNSTLIKYRSVTSHKKKMDLKRRRISLGFEITKDIVEDFKRRADLNGIDFGVVFIPSKERAFFDYLMEKGYKLPPDYPELVDNENKLVDKFSRFFEGLGIKYVDAKPYVLRELYGSGNVYSSTDDGHPVETGYKAYAEAAYDGIITKNKNPDNIKSNGLKP